MTNHLTPAVHGGIDMEQAMKDTIDQTTDVETAQNHHVLVKKTEENNPVQAELHARCLLSLSKSPSVGISPT